MEYLIKPMSNRMMVALIQQDKEAIKNILAQGFKLSDPLGQSSSTTTLLWAIEMLHPDRDDIIALLLEAGAPCLAKDNGGVSPIVHLTCSHKSDERVAFFDAFMRFEERLGPWRESLNEEGQPLLATAISLNQMRMAEKLWQAKAPNEVTLTKSATTALHQAVKKENMFWVDRLCRAQVNLDARDHEAMTPLHRACQNKASKLVLRLLEAGADARLTVKVGHQYLTAEMMAIQLKDKETEAVFSAFRMQENLKQVVPPSNTKKETGGRRI